jgi:peptidoglycan hydrolase-like protein with peptidoglycan-binding domain
MYNLDPMGTFTYQGVTVPVITTHKESYDLKLGSNHGDPINWLKKYGKTMNDVRKDVAALMGKKETPVAPAPKGNTVTLRTLSNGSKGEDVRALQILLKGRVCNGNMYTPDGIFGKNTLGAVKLFQQKYGLEVDGIVGILTWSKLLGV